mmetsp:Transcript_4669/g.9063  ORF Transcript_4669/g.9063 Transcript_4669/m.9063 type:complete len:114 (-) Transcript_4669:128-469(-)
MKPENSPNTPTVVAIFMRETKDEGTVPVQMKAPIKSLARNPPTVNLLQVFQNNLRQWVGVNSVELYRSLVSGRGGRGQSAPSDDALLYRPGWSSGADGNGSKHGGDGFCTLKL